MVANKGKHINNKQSQEKEDATQRQATYKNLQPISGQMDRASATEGVDSGSIPGRVKPETIKIGIHSFPA